MKVTDTTNSMLGFKDDSTGFNDTVDDYTYDLNGNMTKDDNKGITSIKYNHLNLPIEINFTGTSRKITYLYTATGKKLRKVVTNGTVINTTDYLDGFQYNQATAAAAMLLQFFPHAEGYVSNTAVSGNNVFNYVFNFQDHLGNNRLSYTWDVATSSLKILEENNYYPFGLKQQGYNNVYNPTGNEMADKYKYNGKELQDELGLNMTAMDYRQYDNALGRFNSIDALSEMSFSTSPFTFARNNPIFWMDPSGLLSQEFVNSIWNNSNNSGKTVWTNTGSSFSSDDIGNSKAGSVDNNTNEFTGSDALDEVTIARNNRGNASYLGQLQSHVYSSGKFYDSWRSQQRSKKWSDLGQGLQDTGDIISGVG